jgi:predicted lipid-binding transport protein (Tim44 family)
VNFAAPIGPGRFRLRLQHPNFGSPDLDIAFADQVVGWRDDARARSISSPTVAMNFALKDSMVERASGRTVEGGERSEVTELWTFMRARGGNWLLSAIQQT